MSFLGQPSSAARFCFVLSFFLRFSCITAKLFNITIDDSGKDPVTGALIQYLPNSTFWNPSSEACSVCTAHPDPTRAYDGTWHDSSYNPVMGNTVTYAYVPFTGTAIYVFGIVAHTSASPNANADLQFLIDSQVVGRFQLQPTGSTVYDYNVAIYVNESLPNELHNLTIQNGRLGGLKSLLLLDRVMYSQDDGESVSSTFAFPLPSNTTSPAGTSNSSKSVSYAPIIGGVVGGLAFILALGGLLLCLHRRRRKQYSGKTINLPVSESAYPNSGPSSRSMSQAHRSIPSADNPFRIDPILPDAYTSPLSPSALPRPSSSTYGRGHSVADSTLRSASSAQAVATTITDSSSTSSTSLSASTATLPSRSQRRPLRAATRKQPHSHNENAAATEVVEAPPAYEDIGSRDDSAE